jgi:hypothetical protein
MIELFCMSAATAAECASLGDILCFCCAYKTLTNGLNGKMLCNKSLKDKTEKSASVFINQTCKSLSSPVADAENLNMCSL